MKNKRFVFIFFLVLATYVPSFLSAQARAYFDPAQAYNRLLLEKGHADYKLVGAYKVQGTPYLFGEKHMGDIFAKGESDKQIPLSYNTFNQELDFYNNGINGKPMVKPCIEIDSFTMNKNPEIGLENQLIFLNGKLIGSGDNYFYQLVYRGAYYNLYKKYRSVLGIVSTNYIQADLRQYDLDYEFYYSNFKEPDLKKIKPNLPGLKKVFKAEKLDASSFSQEDFDTNPELALVKAIAFANNSQQ